MTPPEPVDEFERVPTRVRTRRQKALLALLAVLPAVASSIGASVAAYRAARSEAQIAAAAAKEKAAEATAQVDDKVRAGYQVTRDDLEALKGRVTRLERALRAAKMPVHAAAPPAPVPLPTTVEKAVEQVKAPEPAKP